MAGNANKYKESSPSPKKWAAPAPCICRKDDDGYRWLNLGCRLHTRLWRSDYEMPNRVNGRTGLSGHDTGQRSRRW